MMRLQTVPIEQAARLARQIGELIRAGLPLNACLLITADIQTSPVMQRSLRHQENTIRNGMPWSQCLLHDQPAWPSELINWVRLGEQTGRLGDCLQHYADTAAASLLFKKKMYQSLSYPALVLCAALVASALMQVLLGVPAEQASHQTSDGAPHILSLGIAGLLVSGTAIWFKNRWRNTNMHALGFQSLRPFRQQRLSLMFQGMSLQIEAGIALIQAIDNMKAAPLLVKDPALRDNLSDWARSLRNGASLSESIRWAGWPSASIALSRVAENSGELGPFFTQLAAIYQQSATHTQERLLQWCAPVTLVIAATILVCSYLAHIWPLYEQMGIH